MDEIIIDDFEMIQREIDNIRKEPQTNEMLA